MTSSMVESGSGRLGSPGSPPSYFKPAPSEISLGPLRFLITDRPNDMSMPNYIEQLRAHNVRLVVRVCEPTYNTKPLQDAGINVVDMEFSDGSPPPAEIREKWLGLVKETFGGATATATGKASAASGKEASSGKGACIAVHCVAGLGRAPVMVALALMEAGQKYESAVEAIRERRRGAINQKQLSYLEKYKPALELKKLLSSKADKDCAIM